MNIMRKLRSSASTPATSGASGQSVSGSSAGGGSAPGSIGGIGGAGSQDSAASSSGGIGGATESPPDSPHTQLGLMHLKKLFNEYTHPKEPLNETERDFKLYNMLPLFCKVFGTSHSADMSEKFWDILSFAQQVSRLMVAEIRRRASNQSTEAASIAIVKFLEIDNCEESSNGWMLLTSLNLLAAGDASLIQVMTTAAVPSTLVKCLYLFFDLPEIPDAIADANDGSDYTARERRILLQKIFVQVLVRLSSYPYPAEELARMDDLTLLFSAITSQCPASNVMWRKSAAEVLTTLSRHGLSDAVVNYIHAKGCIALCVDNIQRAPDLPPLECVEMLVTVFCFLKDSSDVSQVLVDDYRTAHGYAFLTEFLLRLDAERHRGNEEAEPAIRNLVMMVASLCMCGHTELRPAAAAQAQALFQMQGFQVPAMSGRGGTTVRNVHAFQVLQTVFLKTSSPTMGCTLLAAISSVYHSDNANYFILEPQGTLSQFTERLPQKAPAVLESFFEMLEFVVFQLNFVPCKELISLSIMLKADASKACSIRCMRTLLNLLRFNAVFKDVYREVGMLEVFVTCLLRYVEFLAENADPAGNAHDVQLLNEETIRSDDRETLGRSCLEALGILLSANNKNANVFRESGGAKCIHEMVKYRHGRQQTLAMLRELILSVGGEDDMLAVLSTMHSAPADCVELKIHILRALLGCLRDSHRTRTIFRKVGGFVYVTSVFVSLDGKLADEPRATDDGEEVVGRGTDVLPLLQIVCQTLATAMRFEPANAKFFQQEICNTSLCDTLRLLGCFSGTSQLIDAAAFGDDDALPVSDIQSFFHTLFTGNVVLPEVRANIPLSLQFCCIIYRLLYDIALDNFDKPNMASVINITHSTTSGSSASATTPHPVDPRSAVSTLNLTQPQPEPLIVHPGIVICMLQLLPSVEHLTSPQHARSAQIYLAEVIKSLVRSERNQQIMCEAGMAGQLLALCRRALSEEHNPLHASLQYVLERLAAQALQPTELREFLRLGAPLCCESPNLVRPYRSGGPVPLTRIKTLVSMTTPRDFRAHGSCTLPPFVEMDMSAEGFGCLYLPSIAPQSPINVPTAGGMTDGQTTIGGIGSGDRAFPPQTGLTYSTWFCVDKFSDPRTDPHCVRLLTVIRTVSNAREDNLVCLTVLLSARDKAIIVSTQETLVPHNVGEWEPEGSGDGSARIWCPDLLHEGQWHHLVVVLNRAVLKNSSFSLFLDGNHMHTQKLHYISISPGAGTVNVNTANSVYSFIGTPPAWRRYSRLCWKQGVCHLIEDIVTAQVVSTIFALGPHYMGSLQAPQLGKQTEPLSALVTEERVVFGLNAKAMTQLTLAKIRKVYSKADNKAIAKQLGMSSHENATPIRILHNSAGHLAGAARSLGGIVVGYLGVRVFSPHPVSTMMDTVGGCNVLLGIIAMAQDVESLYAGVKALTCVVRSNRAAQSEMDRKRSYQTLAMFFKKKRNLLNSHILHLTFSLVGTVNSGQESSAIPNITAFQDLLCDLDVWHGAPNGLLRSLLEHLLELASESSEKRSNIRIMRELQLVCKLLHIITEIQEAASGTREILFTLLTVLLGGQPRHGDLLLYGQYIAAKIPPANASEKGIDLTATDSADNVTQIRTIILRNRCLQLLHQLLFTARNTVNIVICDDISRILGLDWVLLFMQPHLHRSTVVLAMRILIVLCANDNLIGRFREAQQNGGYLRYTEFVSQQHKIVLGGQPQVLAQQTIAKSTTAVQSTTAQSVAAAASSTAVGMATGAAASVSAVSASVVANVTSSVVGQVSQTAAGSGGVGGLHQLPTQIAQEVKTAVLHVPGFQYLEWLLPHHLDVAELYFLLTALIMGQPVKMLAADHAHFDLDRVWAFLWGAPVSQTTLGTIGPKINLCPEAVCVLLAMVRTIVHTMPTGGDNAWLEQHPVTIVQVLFSLYHNLPDFMPVLMSADVIQSLTAVLFPLRDETLTITATITDSEPNSCATTPDAETGGTLPPPSPHSPARPGDQLTEHPVRKFIIDFLRVIVVDSMSLSMTGKTAPVIDLVLDSSPEASPHVQQVSFQTEIITAIMEHLLAADVLVGEQAALPIVPLLQSHVQNIAPNVFYMTARTVDKLWQGCLQRDPHDVFDFVIKLIAQAKRRSSLSALSLEQLHHSLNRVILYLLSRPTDTVADQMACLEALHKLTTHRLLIFGAGNHELDFIGCLIYCLLQLTADRRIVLDAQVQPSKAQTTWHVPSTPESIEVRDDHLQTHQGRNLIVGAAFRVWEELYVCKKPAIEEVFKITLTAPGVGGKAPSLTATREQSIEAATKLWYNYVDLERKSSYRVPWELHSQIQSKIQKVTGGLTRLASRTKVKKEEFIKARSRLLKVKAFQWTAVNGGLVRDLWEMRCLQNGQMTAHTARYVCQDWLQSERELIRERGLWGPVKDNTLDKWMLDTTEGPHRMRKKTMKNDAFYVQYPYRPELEDPDNRQMKYKVATSFDSKLYFTYCQLPPRVLCEPDALFDANKSTDKQSDVTGSPVQSPTDTGPALTRAQSEPGEEMDEEEDEVSLISDNQTLLRMLEEQEKISYMFRCARIQGLDTTEGLLLFGKEHCYVVDGFTLIKNREIRDIDSLPSGAYDPIVPNPGGSPQRRAITMRQCSKFSYEDIREVHKRRYLLQPIALEVFSGDGRNYLLSFPRKVRNKVYQRFMATATAINDSAQQSVAGQKRGASVEQTSGIFSSLIGETSVTQRWVRGEISNFQYLMHLNTLAGRSYNDLMQYPVFPWILADYESEQVDLSNPKSFRDFSRPMGAQSADRLEQFQKRYKEWDDPHGETPPYHYGTHYSSAMIVCSYLVRLEPFSQHFLRLQGGHFDLADRMFHSIKEAWLSASKFNMADVKELIPEFFYLPEFLSNSNQFDLGSKQNGETLGGVILPPWAKQDAREFIRVHRQALECDYVSQNLHQWIDLIFGHKQQGGPAVDATNVFHHLFYEGNVDIYTIDDPLKKNATIGFINNFGQIPKQLFKKPHPCKKMSAASLQSVGLQQNHRHTVHESAANPMSLHGSAASAAAAAATGSQSDRLFFHNLDNLKPSVQPIKELKGPVGQIHQADKTVLAVEQNKVLMAPLCSRYIAWGFADHSLRIGMYDSDRALFVCEATAQNSGEILACACPNARTIVTAGTSSVVTVWEFDLRRKAFAVKHSLHGHTDAVTCLAASSAYNLIVSGSRDGTAIVWDMSRFVFVRQLREHVGLVAAVSINELTGEVATCSATWLHVWSANGDPLATVNTSIGSADRMQQILCVAFSATREWDQQNVVITGSTDGVVRMWSMEYVQVPVEEVEMEKVASVEEEADEKVPKSAATKMAKLEVVPPAEAEGVVIDLVKRMSISVQAAVEEEQIAKSGSESSLSEACDSLKESSKRFESERDDCSDDEDKDRGDKDAEPKPAPATSDKLNIPQPSSLMIKRGSLTSAKSLHEFKANGSAVAATSSSSGAGASGGSSVAAAAIPKNYSEDEITAKRGIRPSKSDTSLTESFVIVEAGGGEYAKRRNANSLRDGFKWQRQLVFRSKLTMHTAYDRKDNAEPASITALAVSKDHKTLYVGDARGRVYSWSVTEQPGRGMADHWLKDEGADQCVGCHVRFTLYERKHHCRNCGQVFCGKCSRFESEISRLRILKPVRVCQACYATLRHHSVDS